ncbi:hypothetical protein B0H67DRAFT_611635 [Lasiosphaeris hirsuta]|uniref:Synaptobrevin n=1 Tax=Lasiosphaeris hirsuta TaxID=260670 RepID=A0AA40A957_9PEZI|nr:hypothetical protein B0H67DRAFT_611635 [Lasiosphaeris hirsuta]
MVRLIHGIAVPAPSTRQADPLTDLNRLLDRLQQTILRADAEREARLRASEFEREKAQTNIRYAQSLLTKLEQEAIAVKVHARRHEMQADLNRKREALDQLVDRLNDLAEIAAAEANNDDDDTSEGEDILADIIATPSESLDSSRSPDAPPEDPDEAASAADPVPNTLEAHQPPVKEEEDASPKEEPQQSDPPPTATTTTSQALRPRRAAADSSSSEKPAQAQTTGTSPSPPSLALFGDRAVATSHAHAPGATAATATEEAILDHQRAEQDLLSEAILKLAGDLKASSHAFAATLDEDKEVVERAGEGMNRTGEGMQAVTRRMGTLQRMTEGEGWWGRMRLYAQVYGLMVVLVLVVFVLPKLRF